MIPRRSAFLIFSVLYILSFPILVPCPLFLSGCAVPPPPECWKDGKQYGVTNDNIVCYDWDSSYRRGISYAEGECWDQAIEEFLQAIKRRPDDKWRVRSYGMNVLDEYFPHRELGILYLRLGRVENAIGELLTSLESTDSAKAKYYLNKARKIWLEETGLDKAPPVFHFNRNGRESGGIIYTKDSAYSIEGEAIDDFFVSSITIDERRLFIDLAGRRIPFQKDVTLKPGLNFISCRVSDLISQQYEEKLEIYLDQQGPSVIFIPENPEDLPQGRIKEKSLKGFIFDEGGLDKLIIGAQEIPLVYGKRIREFEVDIHNLDMGQGFKVTDLAGNTTEGDLAWIWGDEEYEDVAWPDFNGASPNTHKAVKVCDNGPFVPIPSYNRLSYRSEKGPIISIRDYPAIVFEPFITIQGRVVSNSEIREVYINEESVLSNQKINGLMDAIQRFLYGKRTIFYFTRRIEGLKEGENRLSIRAEDKNGRSIIKDLTVEYRIREFERIGNRWCLAVLPFEKYERNLPLFVSREPDDMDSLDESLHFYFFQSKRFRMVERDRVDAIIREKHLKSYTELDKELCNRLSKILSAEVLLLGSIREGWDGKDRILWIFARLVEAETAEILAFKDVYNQWKCPDDEEHLLNGLVQKFMEEFPILQGRIKGKNDEMLELTLCKDDLIKRGMKVWVYRDKGGIKGQEILGDARVEKVGPDFSEVLPLEKILLDVSKVGDLVITK